MKLTLQTKLRNSIINDYFKTTSSRNIKEIEIHLQNSVEGLQRWLSHWLPSDKNSRCLDLGCGLGETIYLLETKGYKYTTGVNLCKEEIDQAKKFVNGNLVHSDAIDYLKSCSDCSFDFLTALNFLEHLPKDELLTVMTESKRVLKPGGTLVAMVPNAISPFSGVTRFWDITHEWAFTPNNFKQLALVTGFDHEIDFQECGPRIHGFFSFFRVILWHILRFFIATWFLIELGNTKGRIYTMDMLVRLRVRDNIT